MRTGYPETSAQPLWGRRNASNLVLLLLVPLPGVAATLWLFDRFAPGRIPPDPGWQGIVGLDSAAAWLLHNPIVTVNLLFFVNVCLLFWLISLLQQSSWLIDPYWTLIPLALAAFYWAHPLARADAARSALSLALLGLWSFRLTHNYLRREQWRLGLREDWRFAKLRSETRHFWWIQFFYVYLAQQLMLVGLTLPYWAMHFRATPFGAWDAVLAVLALAGIGIAHLGDTQLDGFMRENETRARRGEPKRPLLDCGVWRYSRRPNYFGEQLFWWSMAGFGVVLGEPWVVVGTLINSLVLAAVTGMTERRMLADPARSEVYADYMRRTSVWIPWPPRVRRDLEPEQTAS